MVDKNILDDCLEGLSFPTDGQTILETARANRCPTEVLSRLYELPGQTFETEEELFCDLGEMQSC